MLNAEPHKDTPCSGYADMFAVISIHIEKFGQNRFQKLKPIKVFGVKTLHGTYILTKVCIYYTN